MTRHRYFPVAVLLALVLLAIAIMLRIDYNRQLQEAERQAFLQAWEEQEDVARRLFEENSTLCQAIVDAPTEEAREPLLLDLQDKYREITGYLYFTASSNKILLFYMMEDYVCNHEKSPGQYCISLFDDMLYGGIGPVSYQVYLVYHPGFAESEVYSECNETALPLSPDWSFYKSNYGLV